MYGRFHVAMLFLFYRVVLLWHGCRFACENHRLGHGCIVSNPEADAARLNRASHVGALRCRKRTHCTHRRPRTHEALCALKGHLQATIKQKNDEDEHNDRQTEQTSS